MRMCIAVVIACIPNLEDSSEIPHSKTMIFVFIQF